MGSGPGLFTRSDFPVGYNFFLNFIHCLDTIVFRHTSLTMLFVFNSFILRFQRNSF